MITESKISKRYYHCDEVFTCERSIFYWYDVLPIERSHDNVLGLHPGNTSNLPQREAIHQL